MLNKVHVTSVGALQHARVNPVLPSLICVCAIPGHLEKKHEKLATLLSP